MECQQLWHLQVCLGAAVGHAVLMLPNERLEAPLYTLPDQSVAASQRRMLPALGVQKGVQANSPSGNGAL